MKGNVIYDRSKGLDRSRLYFVELDEAINFSKYGELIKLLPIKKREQIQKFHFEVDKKLCLLSDVLVRYLACNILNVSNSDLQFEKNEYGKPYIIGANDFHYNISHTRNAFVVGISREPIGVDIEKIKECEMGIANRFFTPEEVRYIKKGNEEDSKRFYEIWTKKEAYVKWVGKGLSIPLNSFDVLDFVLSCKLSSFQMGDYWISSCHVKDIIGNAIELDEEMIRCF